MTNPLCTSDQDCLQVTVSLDLLRDEPEDSSQSSSDEELEQFLCKRIPYTQQNKGARKRDVKAKSKATNICPDEGAELPEEDEYSFSPVMASADRKVPINFTDLSKLGNELDTSKDVPLKKPQSAYVLFGNEQRIVISQKYKGLKVTEVVKMIAKEWQKLTKQQRQKYKDAAKRDKERFSQELAKLSRVNDQTLLYQMPKKPLTAYMFFVRQTRVRVAKEMPEIAPLDIMKEVGKEWQRCSSKDLLKFKQMAKNDEARYQQEMYRFISHLNQLRLTIPQQVNVQSQQVLGEQANRESADDSARQMQQMSRQQREDGSTANITPVKVLHQQQTLSPTKVYRPKKPLSAYIFYSQEQRDYLKKENPHLSTRDVMMQVSKQWSLLKKSERQYYIKMASDDKRRFESQMSELRLGIAPKMLSVYGVPTEATPQFLRLDEEINLPLSSHPPQSQPLPALSVLTPRQQSFQPQMMSRQMFPSPPGLNLMHFKSQKPPQPQPTQIRHFSGTQHQDDEIQELSPLLMQQQNNMLFEFDY